jgi:hypothetical protein
MSNALIARVAVMVVVVAVLTIWLHMWWLAIAYAAFWAALLVVSRRRAARRSGV